MSIVQLTQHRSVSAKDACFFIAEIGQNHQGSLEEAKKLIDAARLAGADCVKFQKTSLPDRFSKYALEQPYKSEHAWGKTYGEHKKHLEFSEGQFRVLKSYAERSNIAFTASPKDIQSLKFLIDLDVPFIKIGSGDAEDILLLEEAALSGIPLVISTGMLDFISVRRIYDLVKRHHNKFVLLHCVSSYPTEAKNVNLRVMVKFKDEFPDIHVGYSGHELGTAISIAAIALGAKVIERHITLDKSQKGSDHACSLLPAEFKSMVDDARIVEQALGVDEKIVQYCEMPCYMKLAKTLVSADDHEAGFVLTGKDIKIKTGHPKIFPAKDYEKLIGKKLSTKILSDETILPIHLCEDVCMNSM